jgi:hypothetical protein
MSKIRMSHAYGETPPNVFSDFAWVRAHKEALLTQYGECSIIVYQERVIGSGLTYESALADAENNLPTESGEITPIHERLHDKSGFYRVRKA